MPIHGIAALLEGKINYRYAVLAVFSCTVLLAIKTYASGRKNTWTRDWAGKMIFVLADPNPITLELLHQLVHLPQPPQVLYLPPLVSPLPEKLLTILQAIRLSATTANPSAQISCEPLPRTPLAVQEFVKRWAVNPVGTGEGGRRLDAVIVGDDWEVHYPFEMFKTERRDREEERGKDEWTVQECKFHFITAMLPFCLKAPMERPIRWIQLVSPFFAAALPSVEENVVTLQGKTKVRKHSPVVEAGVRSWRSILLFKHLQRVLNALASASQSQSQAVAVPVPDQEGDEGALPKKKISVQSNILALSVVMPFNRSGIVRPLFGFEQMANPIGYYAYILLSPLIYLLTPSNSWSIQSILFALSAPVLYDEEIAAEKGASTKFIAKIPRKDGVRGGSIIRDCTSFAPPVVEASADTLGQKVWEDLERVVEARLEAMKASGEKTKAASIPKDDGVKQRSAKVEEINVYE